MSWWWKKRKPDPIDEEVQRGPGGPVYRDLEPVPTEVGPDLRIPEFEEEPDIEPPHEPLIDLSAPHGLGAEEPEPPVETTPELTDQLKQWAEDDPMPTMVINFDDEELAAAIRFWLLAKLPGYLSDKAKEAKVHLTDCDSEETTMRDHGIGLQARIEM